MPANPLFDRIADLVNPVAAVVALGLPWLRRPASVERGGGMVVLTLAAIALAYVVRAVDEALRLWPRIGLDYSTHTAVFVAIASSVWQHGRAWRWPSAALGACYAALMVRQGYHSPLDIATTTAALLPATALLWSVATPRRERQDRAAADCPAGQVVPASMCRAHARHQTDRRLT